MPSEARRAPPRTYVAARLATASRAGAVVVNIAAIRHKCVAAVSSSLAAVAVDLGGQSHTVDGCHLQQ